jgi:hypothetical protein
MYSNFKRYEEALDSLDVGKVNLIKSWLLSMNISNYSINDDYTIDIKQDVNLSYKNIIKFPEFIHFNKIKGSFYCSHNKLKSLKGCPKYVDISFFCDDNELSSLSGGPVSVNGSYIAHNNILKSLHGLPTQLNNFSCNSNLLISLHDIPKTIYGDLYCQDNFLVNLHNFPTNIKGNLYINFKNNNITIEDIRKVCYVEGDIYI